MSRLNIGGVGFHIAPTIGHCRKLKGVGIDILSATGDAVARIVTDPEQFVTALYTMIEDQIPKADDRFEPEAFGFLIDGETWNNAVDAMRDGFVDFFQARRDTKTVALIRKMFAAGEAATDAIADELNGLDIEAMKQRLRDGLKLNESVANAIDESLRVSVPGS